MLQPAFAAAFAKAKATTAQNKKPSSYEVCMAKEIGFAAAAPCMSKFVRAANQDYAYVRQYAATIDVIGEHRRARRITEDEALARFQQALRDFNTADRTRVKNEVAENERAIRAHQARSMSQAWDDAARDLQRTWSMQQMMHPNCTRWGVC